MRTLCSMNLDDEWAGCCLRSEAQRASVQNQLQEDGVRWEDMAFEMKALPRLAQLAHEGQCSIFLAKRLLVLAGVSKAIPA